MPIDQAPPKKGVKRYRRPDASRYLKTTWGLDYAPRTLAKLGCVGGGPRMEYAGRFPTYTEQDLDAFAEAKIGAPVANTSERTLQKTAA